MNEPRKLCKKCCKSIPRGAWPGVIYCSHKCSELARTDRYNADKVRAANAEGEGKS